MPLDLPTFEQFGFTRLTPPPRKPAPPEEPVSAYDQLTPEKRAEVDREVAMMQRQRELAAQPRGALAEIGTGLARGAMVELPRMVGQGLKSTGVAGDALYGIGKKITDSADAREVGYAADQNEGAHGAVVDAFAQGASMVAPSLAPMLALPALGALGVPAAAGVAAAGAAGAGMFGASQFQDTYEKGIKAGLSPEDAKVAGAKTGLIEAVGEGVGSMVGAKFITGASKLFPRMGGKRYTIDNALKSIRNPEFLPGFAKNLGQTMLVETATEMGQGAGEAAVEYNAGIEKTTPWDAATSAIGPTLAMTALLGPLGAFSLRAQQKRNQQLISAVESDKTDFATTDRAMRQLAPQLEPLVGKEEVNKWRGDVLLRANQIEAGTRQMNTEQQEANLVASPDGKSLDLATPYTGDVPRRQPFGVWDKFGKQFTSQLAAANTAQAQEKVFRQLATSELPDEIPSFRDYVNALQQPGVASAKLTPQGMKLGYIQMVNQKLREHNDELRLDQRDAGGITPAEAAQEQLDLTHSATAAQPLPEPAERAPWTAAPEAPSQAPTALQQAFAAAGGQKALDTEAAYAQRAAEQVAPPLSMRTKQQVEKQARVAAANKLADDAMAGKINGNTPVAAADFKRVMEQAAQEAGLDLTPLKGQHRAKVDMAITAASKKKLYVQQLTALRAERDALKPKKSGAELPLRYTALDVLIRKLENFNGQADAVSTQGQGNAQAGTGQQGQEALLNPFVDKLAEQAVAPAEVAPAPAPVNAAPVAEVVPTPPPVPAEAPVAAPIRQRKEVVVSSTGAEREAPGAPVPWGAFARNVDGTVDYSTRPPGARQTLAQQAAARADEERFTPAPYHAEVRPEDRRQVKDEKGKLRPVEDEKLFTFEILNYNPDSPRGEAFVNTGWSTSYEKAEKQSLQVGKDGKPTPQALNAKAALKWLEEYEGEDIGKRVVLRRLSELFELNKNIHDLAVERAEDITRQITIELDNIALERKKNIALGMNIDEATNWSRTQLLAINKKFKEQEDELRDRNETQIAQNRAKAKPEAVKLKQALRPEYMEVLQMGLDDDPRLYEMKQVLPNYVQTPDLMKATETGKLDRVLQALENSETSPWVQYMAGTLRRLGLGTSVRVSGMVARDERGSRVYARYDHSTNTVTVFVGGANAHTLVHEISHAATVARIALAKAALRTPFAYHTSDEKAAVSSLLDLQAFMGEMKKLDTKRQYAFRSEEEFVAEVMSNEKFQAWLQQHTYDGRSAWDKFKDWVRVLFGASPMEGTNALNHALSLVPQFTSNSRFGAADGKSFNHSATAAASVVDRTMSTLRTQWEMAAVKHPKLSTLSRAVRRGLWHASTSFNMARWVDKVAELRAMVPGVHAMRAADELKTRMLQLKQMEFSTITTDLALATAKLPKAQKAAMDAQLMGYAFDQSTLGIDLNKNFDANKKDNPTLDAANKDYINSRHAEYMRLPSQFKKPFESSIRVFRKDYIQHTAQVTKSVLEMYAKDTPQFAALADALDILNPELGDKRVNPKPEFFYDAYSADLDILVRETLKKARAVVDKGTHAWADLQDVEKFYNAAVANPYMHLGRSGDHFIEFDVSDAPGAWDAMRSALAGANKVIGAPSEKRHVFMRFEDAAARDAAKRAVEGLGGAIRQESVNAGSLFDGDKMDRMQGVPAFVHRLRSKALVDFEGPERTEMRAWLLRAMIDAHADTSPQKALTRRKDGGVPGADATFARNFTKRASGMATMLANTYTIPEYDKAFDLMKDAVNKMTRPSVDEKTGAVTPANAQAADWANEVMSELSTRFSNSLSPVDSPVVDRFKAFGFNYFLAFSPAFWLTNMMQPYHLTLPFIGGRYGFVATMKEMKVSTAKGYKLIKAAAQSGWAEGKEVGGIRGAIMGVLDLSLPLEQTGLRTDEVEFLRKLIESGQLDTTQGHELGRIADGDSQEMTSAMKLMSMGSHYTEVLNRLTSGLTAYNMARNKGSTSAVQYGILAVRETQFDYSDRNTARALGRHGVAGKLTPLLASFQQYSFQTMELLIRMATDSFMPFPPNATEKQIEVVKAERSAARKGLGGILATSSILAGTLGLPLANAVAALVDRVLGDDDDPVDVKSAYREWLAGVVGKDVAEAVARGVPRAVLGFDTSTRMGMQDVLPGTRFMADRRAFKDKVESGAFNLLGPAVSATTSMATGLGKFSDGQIMDGLIEMLPLALKGPVKAAKMDEQGFTTSTGNKLPIDVTPWSMVAQTVGFTPAAKAEQSEVNFAFRQRDGLLKQQKTRLANKFYLAKEAGDDTTSELQDIMKFNEANPQYAIDVSSGLVARARARATAASSESGIATLPRYLPQLERYSYANVK